MLPHAPRPCQWPNIADTSTAVRIVAPAVVDGMEIHLFVKVTESPGLRSPTTG
jgi:hypothetical protein